ncbi:ABC-2 type transport system ATP-binding protein [Alkalispirochaeta americana]|uniref:ABC-2 type transport system ATP-binding protein n=1 Tax=Alkalispirochaeta americana TaxID=159291 RepID=A0A1N6RVR7_9SPIO|nr:ABC transporter ATP-binding protein [Alkalispirochaeta americana]SIQ32984.1 ABC-2 type transport system ATP-binding protein [Alkalispirochaeta americana]
MIRFETVEKDYGDVKALRGVSFEVPCGGIVGLLGPNGAGKTTALRIMTGFLEPTAGQVFLDDQPFTPDSVEARRRIGYLPESAPLYGDMFAWDYLVYEARLHGLDPSERVPQVVRQVGLASHVHKPIRELSKGYRQRVGLAHALLHDPEILVLDEPTSGLDPNQILEVRALIRRIAETKTVILSTHIMQEVAALCRRVVVIHQGQVRFQGLLEDFSLGGGVTGGMPVRMVLAGIDPVVLLKRLEAIPGVERVELLEPGRDGIGVYPDPSAVIVRVFPRAGLEVRPELAREALSSELYEIVQEQSSLEDVFHALTREVHHG